MIICYFGKMRQGKSLLMVKEILSLLNKGEVVYSNLKINWKGYNDSWWRILLHKLTLVPIIEYPATNLRYFRSWDDVAEVKDCTIALDEGWLHFNSYQRLHIDQQRRLLQSGKRRMDFLYTAQRPLQTDINMRWNTDVFIEAKKYTIFGFNIHRYKWYDLKEDDSNAILDKVREVQHKDGSVTKIDMALSSAFLFNPKKLYNAYDTEFEVYESKEAEEQAISRRQTDDLSRVGTISPITSYWHDFKNLIRPKKHDNRQFISRKAKPRKKKQTSMVDGLRGRSNIKHVSLDRRIHDIKPF